MSIQKNSSNKILLTLFFTIFFCVCRASYGATQNTPNIVFILLDDLDVDSPYWDVMPKTKAWIGDKGMVFNNAFAPTPACCPARVSMITGLYGHNAGVLVTKGDYGGFVGYTTPLTLDGDRMTDDKGNHINNEDRTILLSLQKMNYRTAMFGKFVHDIPEKYLLKGFNEFAVGIDEGLYYGYDYVLNEYNDLKSSAVTTQHYDTYVTDLLANKAVDFIKRTSGKSPFFLWLTPTAPHMPLPPAPRHQSLALKWKLPKNQTSYKGRVNFCGKETQEQVEQKATWISESYEFRKLILDKRINLLSGGGNDIDFYNRMGSLMAVDDMVERVRKTLLSTGQMDNTIIIFASDNGYNLGAHCLTGKGVPYRESIRIPLIFSGKGIKKGISNDMIAHIDLSPTILDLVGADHRDYQFDGASFASLLRTESTPSTPWNREDIFFQVRMPFEYDATWFTDYFNNYLPSIMKSEPKKSPSGFPYYEMKKLGDYVPTDLDLFDPKNLLRAQTMIKNKQADPEFLDFIYFHAENYILTPGFRALRDKEYLLIEWNDNMPIEYEFYNIKKDPYQLNNLSKKLTEGSYDWLKYNELMNKLNQRRTCKGIQCRE